MIRKLITQQVDEVICTAVKEDGTVTKGTCREALTAILWYDPHE